MTESEKPAVLFLCTGNSCRSQMAEGFARHLHGASYRIFSAGTVAKGVHPLAARVMDEAGVSIAAQTSKTLASLLDAGVRFDAVVTVCGHAAEHCPVFPGKVFRLHAGFDDPPELARHAKSEEEALRHFRRVRDEIRAWMADLPGHLTGLGARG